MDDLPAARSQMALSLAFHIVFAVVGMAMPLLMVLAEATALRTGDDGWKLLARAWSKGTAIVFAVGAVSGTVLSFELGLLWPGFMRFAGPIVGMPFSLEGFAFFLEAIFLGVYLYGWERVPPRAHLLAGVGVWVSGMASGLFVVSANAWMNTPTGFTVDGAGRVVDVDPWAAMLNPAMPSQVLHMLVAALVSMGFLAAGIHAFYLRRAPGDLFHRRALAVALAVAIPSALAQPLTGHVAAEHVAEVQPIKLAAAEAQWETARGAALTIGGWPDEAAQTTRYGIEIPKLLSVLAFGDPDAEVLGLKAFPRDERPPVRVVHVAYEAMLGLGTLMALTAVGVGVAWARRRRVPDDPRLLAWLVVMAPAGILAVEAGWVVTEVGRQPWVIRGVLRTADAATPMPGIGGTLALYAALYAFLSVMTAAMLLRQFRHPPDLGPVLPAEPLRGAP
jgi:cytochrome d ubiquinol oxidase subunit I